MKIKSILLISLLLSFIIGCSSDISYDIDDARDNCKDQYESGFYDYEQYQECLENI